MGEGSGALMREGSLKGRGPYEGGALMGEGPL